jgi:PIN domain nuclease of toxin-antitoxin system
VTDLVVLDSSAVLALINDEPGADQVEAHLDRAVIAAANLAEVAGKLGEKGLDAQEVSEVLAIFHDVRPMTAEQALVIGQLRAPTRHLGLSLGDRACLALALELGAVALTADTAWSMIDASDIKPASVELIR